MLNFLNCLRLGEQVTGIPEVPFLWCWNLLSSWFLLEPPWLPGMVSSAGRVLSHTLLGILTVSEICFPYFFFLFYSCLLTVLHSWNVFLYVCMLKYVHHSTHVGLREQLVATGSLLRSQAGNFVRLCDGLPYPLSHLASPTPPLPSLLLMAF